MLFSKKVRLLMMTTALLLPVCASRTRAQDPKGTPPKTRTEIYLEFRNSFPRKDQPPKAGATSPKTTTQDNSNPKDPTPPTTTRQGGYTGGDYSILGDLTRQAQELREKIAAAQDQKQKLDAARAQEQIRLIGENPHRQESRRKCGAIVITVVLLLAWLLIGRKLREEDDDQKLSDFHWVLAIGFTIATIVFMMVMIWSYSMNWVDVLVNVVSGQVSGFWFVWLWHGRRATVVRPPAQSAEDDRENLPSE